MNDVSPPTKGAGLRVVCFTTFVPHLEREDKRQRAAKSFLLALKGQTCEETFTVPVGKELRELSPDNSNDALDWFGETAARYLESKSIRPPFSLVPVPEHDSTVDSTSGPWTSALALSISWQYFDGVDVVDILRFRERQTIVPSTDVGDVYDNLVVVHPPARGENAPPLILIDHVFTDGRFMRACAARLVEAQGRVLLALAAGRTASSASHEAFRPVSGRLKPFVSIEGAHPTEPR